MEKNNYKELYEIKMINGEIYYLLSMKDVYCMGEIFKSPHDPLFVSKNLATAICFPGNEDIIINISNILHVFPIAFFNDEGEIELTDEALNFYKPIHLKNKKYKVHNIDIDVSLND